MKLDATDLRYISNDAFRVLSAVEQGSKNHEVVPSSLIAQLAGSRAGGVNKALGELAKKKLVAKVQNAKYEGYRLTYGGYDFLACRTFAKRDTIYSVGNQIGTGKESGELGRMSFRAIKSKRDYLRKGQSASWMYMSRLAAIKEFAFMKVLHDHGFPVPQPIDQSRHCLVMELIDAFPLRQISAVPSPGGLYSALMDMIVRLARSGLIHGDFNEFNLLIRDHRTEAEKDRDDEMPDDREARIERDGGDFPVKVELEGEEYEERKRREREGTLLEPVLIDFPQMVSTDHPDAEYYFNRDVECIRTFFSRRFKYESSVYPKFTTVVRDGVREFDLDVEVAASGFKKEDRRALEEYMAELAAHDAANPDPREVASDEEYSDEEEEDDEDAEGDEQTRAADEREGADEPEEVPQLDGLRIADDAAREDVSEGEDEEDEEGEEGTSDEDEEEDPTAHRRHRPSAPRQHRTTRDVESIVTATLSRKKQQSERRHHGKKPVSANVLGRQKGSKKKQNAGAREARQASKGGDRGGGFF
ncbi:hypothetical protein Rhopal_003147-T1 [Rhodotorula paludigena]|uniref:Serine/threonine-protein kinase RIO2 n=1 Tax=Rhodotorula paludigena TaxID=86838 RepID=A0AAV5GIX7_9BASI|nr:hypothetical protein Rhopal_003147-T1 [Rhodotorula paludigena]